MCGAVMETCAVDHSAGRGFVCVVQQVSIVVVAMLGLMPRYRRQRLSFVCVHRVYLLYHTWGQVIYGGVAGMVVGVVWFFITQEVLTPIFPKIAAW